MKQCIEDIVHWVDGECRIRPEVRTQWDDETRRDHPHMTEEQILAMWGALEVTFGITIGPPQAADNLQGKFGRWRRAMRVGEAMIGALEAGDGPAALEHLAEARRLDPIVAEIHVQTARGRRLL